MFMFQNGLLVTFIPEILMVIGYVLCLFAPGLKPTNSTIDQSPFISQVVTVEQQNQNSAYQVSYSDFQIPEITPEKIQFILPFVEKETTNTSDLNFSTSDGLSYVGFSRPPPFSVS
jgi:hypothetical protein